MSRRSRRGGFTLVELMFAIGVIATASLMLVATLSSQARMNALARERSLATNAVRSYIEAMRQKYPAKGSVDMSGFINDPTSPADYLPIMSAPGTGQTVGLGALEMSSMRDARGLVLKMSDETGFSWGMGASSLIGTTPATATLGNWLWTDNTCSNFGTVTTGSYTASASGWTLSGGRLTNTPVANGSSYFPNQADLDSMGYIKLGSTNTVLGRDLDGDGQIRNLDQANGARADYINGQLFVPCQITMSWQSGSGNAAQASNTTTGNTAGRSRQRITVYAAFGPIH